MALVIERSQLVDQLAVIRTLALGGGVNLYTNNYTPDADSASGDFTDPGWPSYAGIPTPSWTAIAASGQEEVTTHPNVSWINDDVISWDVYGYWVYDALGSYLFAERFAGAPITLTAGQGLILSLQFRQRAIP